jgi:hypothetical protein
MNFTFTLLKFVLVNIFFPALTHFVTKVIRTMLSAMLYPSKCNLLYQTIFLTLQYTQNYPPVDTTGYLNPRLLTL